VQKSLVVSVAVKKYNYLILLVFLTSIPLFYMIPVGYANTDNGFNSNFTKPTANNLLPKVHLLNNYTFVVWQDNSTGNNEVFLRKSIDGGNSFENITNISNNNASSMYPQIGTLGNTTFVVWQDNSTGNNEVLLVKNTGDNQFYDPKNAPSLNVLYQGGPTVNDTNLKVQIVAKGINFPTSMTFLGPSDIIVLEKNTGKVRRIVNGNVIADPLLDVNVANKQERGMLGVDTSSQDLGQKNKALYVFLYYTETQSRDGEDLKGRDPLGNRLYRYDLVENKLLNPKLLLDLPSIPGSVHNGGKVLVGPDNNVYLTIGDVNRNNKNGSNSTITRSQNQENGLEVDGRAGILRVTQEGHAAKAIIGMGHPSDKYFAYGIRNSFGIDFDPVTGKLWDTEIGPTFGDEINLVEPGFNSGWNKIQGIWQTNENSPGKVASDTRGLYNFNNTGHYRSPQFTWFDPTTGPTAIIFLDSNKLGEKYLNELFVSGFHDGNIYNFKLASNRTALLLKPPLADKVSDNKNETQGIIFAQGFGGVTDMKVGPDGFLYVLSLYAGGDDCGITNQPSALCIPYSKPLDGTIFRIMPK
jgi:glucose/arabinose dehydrogenase